MTIESSKLDSLSVAEVENEINFLIQQVRATGSWDSEPNALKSIIDELRAGTIGPAHALDRARSIISSRQDYH